MERLIFHIDVNSAFLSWEAAKRVALGEPDLREIPSAIGGDPTSRTSIISAKSIPAKKYGINTGEPVSMALRKCPELVVVPGDFDLYVRCSRAFKAICQEYSPSMESFSIDEVFLDMSGMHYIYPDPIATAYEIKDRIYKELGFTVNVGIGESKLCAKMASDFEKPNKVHTLFDDEIPTKMWPLPIGDLFSCGKSSAAKLSQAGFKTIGDLANSNIFEIKMLLGDKTATILHNYANGIDDSEVNGTKSSAKGYSSETTVDDDLCDLEAINHILLAQADVVTARMRADGAKCRCVCVTFRDLNFVTKSHQVKLDEETDLTELVYNTATKLVKESWNGSPLRLVGLSLTDIDRDSFEQLSFITDERSDKLKKLDSTLDSIRDKFGDDSVKRLSTLDFDKKINRRHKAEKKK